MRTAFTVSVDYRHGTTTGISADDRAATIQALVDPATRPGDLARPGHIFPLRGPRGRRAQAGRPHRGRRRPRPHGRPATRPACCARSSTRRRTTWPACPSSSAFAEEHGLLLISIADLIRYRRQTEKLVRRVGEARIPTQWGDFTCYAYESVLDGEQHLAFVRGAVQGQDDVLVRVHSECLTGDVFGSLRCDCGPQLARRPCGSIAEEGLGVVVYLRGHEGRGIGIGHKLQAYALQEQGHDTVDANLELGLPVDSREYGIGAQILVDLGITTMRTADQQPGQVRRPRGLRPRDRRAGAARDRRPTPRTSPTCAPSASAWATCSRASTMS